MSAALPEYDWRVMVRDPAANLIGELEPIDLELHPRDSSLGSWLVNVWHDGDSASLTGKLAAGAGYGLVFAVNDVPVLSGPVTSPHRIVDGDRRTLTIAGTCDLQWVADRQAHPDPATAAPPYADSDTRTGVAETVIKSYVAVNAGRLAVTARQVPHLELEADAGRGNYVTATARFQNLLDFLNDLTKTGGVGFRALHTAPGKITFSVFTRNDKSAEIIFGVEVGNLAKYDYALTRPKSNYEYAAGKGTGTARVVREGSDATSALLWGRIERFLDQGSTADTAQIDQAIAAALASDASTFALGTTTVDTAGHQWAPVAQPGASTFDLGDIVSVVIDGKLVTEAIRELVVVYSTAAGTKITPVIGPPANAVDPARRLLARLIAELRNVKTQLLEIQRR